MASSFLLPIRSPNERLLSPNSTRSFVYYRAPFIEKHIFSRCSSSTEAAGYIELLAGALLTSTQLSAPMNQYIISLDKACALRQAQFEAAAADPASSLSSVVQAVAAEAHALTKGFASTGDYGKVASGVDGTGIESFDPSPLPANSEIESALISDEFRKCLVALEDVDTTTIKGRVAALMIAFASDCPVILRVLHTGNVALSRSHKLLGSLLLLRGSLSQYAGYCQAFNPNLGKVPERGAEWDFAGKSQTNVAALNSFLKQEYGKINWWDAPSGLYALKTLLTKTAYLPLPRLDRYCVPETIREVAGFQHRTFVGFGWPSTVPAAQGFTCLSWFELVISLVNSANSLPTKKEQYEWLQYIHDQVLGFYACARVEVQRVLTTNVPGAARSRPGALMPYDGQPAENLRRRLSDLEKLAENQHSFSFMRPDAPLPINPHVFLLLSSGPNPAKTADAPRKAGLDPGGRLGEPPEKKQRTEPEPTKPGQQKGRWRFLSADELIFSTQVWSVGKIAKDFKIQTASRCWPHLLCLSDVYRPGICSDFAKPGHKHPKDTAHVLAGFKNDATTRAKYARRATDEEVATLDMPPFKPVRRDGRGRGAGRGRGRGKG